MSRTHEERGQENRQERNRANIPGRQPVRRGSFPAEKLRTSQLEVTCGLEDAPYRFIGGTVIARHLAQRFVILLNAGDNGGPLRRWNFPFGELRAGVALEKRLGLGMAGSSRAGLRRG
jgi:hypothetical protein